MTIYFAKYKDEELGWNTALGNSLVLIFVSLNLFQTIFNYGRSVGTIVLASLLLVFGLVLMFVNFTHYLPKKISYFLSSPLSVNLIAYIFIAIVYGHLPVDIFTLLASLMFFVGLLGLFLGFGWISKRWWTRVERLKDKEHIEDVKKERVILEGKKKEVKEEEKKIKKVVLEHESEVKKKQVELKKIKKEVKKAVKGTDVKRNSVSKKRSIGKKVLRKKNKTDKNNKKNSANKNRIKSKKRKSEKGMI
jgi:hypothetical protein